MLASNYTEAEIDQFLEENSAFKKSVKDESVDVNFNMLLAFLVRTGRVKRSTLKAFVPTSWKVTSSAENYFGGVVSMRKIREIYKKVYVTNMTNTGFNENVDDHMESFKRRYGVEDNSGSVNLNGTFDFYIAHKTVSQLI